MDFILSSMTCGHCVRTVTEALEQLDPDATVTIDLPTRRVQVQTTENEVAVREALAAAGYEPDHG